jgi:hypothetical protein
MANVLGTLFSDIATAIRNKTGTTNKMSPKDFPVYINNIVVNGGGGENENKQWKFASGTAISTGGAMTITHNLGSIPDIISVRLSKSQDDTNIFLGSLQFSDSMVKAMNGTGQREENGLGIADLSTWGAVIITPEEGVEGEHSNFGEWYGTIRKADTTTFTVGGGSYASIPSGKEFRWFAVSGIT